MEERDSWRKATRLVLQVLDCLDCHAACAAGAWVRL